MRCLVTSDTFPSMPRSARETDIYCSARLLKLGKRTAYGTAECRNAVGDLLTHHVLSYALVN
jgi:acyl-coenzyme A thioesterase PaaI-like protein